MMSRSAALGERWLQGLLLLMAAFYAGLDCRRARADALDRVELTWRAPPGCPNERYVRASIRKLIGTAELSDLTMHVEATVTRNARGAFHLTLVVRGDSFSGERALDGGSCADLAGATAVNLVLLLQSAVSERRLEAVSTTTPDAARDTAERKSNEILPQLPNVPAQAEPGSSGRDLISPPRTWRFLLQLPSIGLSLGLLPRPSASAALGGGLMLGRWRFMVGGEAWLPQRLAAVDAVGAAADAQHVAVSVRACRGFALGRFELAPCTSIAMELLWARGEGLHVAPQRALAPWLAVGAGVQARLELAAWLAIFAWGAVAWQGARPRLLIAGLGPLEQLGAAAVSFSLGSEWIL